MNKKVRTAGGSKQQQLMEAGKGELRESTCVLVLGCCLLVSPPSPPPHLRLPQNPKGNEHMMLEHNCTTKTNNKTELKTNSEITASITAIQLSRLITHEHSSYQSSGEALTA